MVPEKMTSETQPKEAPIEAKATSTEVKVDLFEDDDEFEEFDIDIGIFNDDGFLFLLFYLFHLFIFFIYSF